MIREQPKISYIWVYLSGNPLFALVITLAAYQLGNLLYQRTNNNPFANPVAIAVVLIALVLYLIDMPYQKYFEGAQFVHFLLGTATVALAVPIYKGFSILKTRLIPLTVALLCGGVVSIASAVGIATFMGADTTIIGSIS
jgi:putative effector of murein hydrolase